MATTRIVEYKIEKNVPLIRLSGRAFDETQPEYITMLKLKPGESFEFPAERARNIAACRGRIRKDHPEIAFTATGEASLKAKRLSAGRCWRLPDGTTKKFKNNRR